MNSFKYNTVKRMHMKQPELKQLLMAYQVKLWGYLGEQDISELNHSYIKHLEDNIEEIRSLLTPKAA